MSTYNLLDFIHRPLAGKITGMILDLETSKPNDFDMTLQNFETFRVKVLEAQQMILNTQMSNGSSDNASSIKGVAENNVHGTFSVTVNSSASFLGSHSNE